MNKFKFPKLNTLRTITVWGTYTMVLYNRFRRQVLLPLSGEIQKNRATYISRP